MRHLRGHLVDRRNLAFDGESPPLTRVSFAEGTMLVSLDTGAQGGTQFWQRFGEEFPVTLARGARGARASADVQQIGGRRQEDVVVVPDLRLRLDAVDAVLPRARVFIRRPGVGDGNVGMDIFSQASEVAFDFRRMTVAFRPRQ